jgi:hypothetical protein
MSFNPYEEKFHDELLAKGYMFEAELLVNLLIIDEGILMRVKIDQDKVAEYRDLWLQGIKLPPLDVFADVGGDKKERVSDGFHRLLGAKEAKLERIPCKVFRGTRRDAILHACKANTKHGWRANALDRRKAVITLLLDNEWTKESNYWIADQCGSEERTVRRIIEELKAKGLLPADRQAKPENGIYIYGNAVDSENSPTNSRAGESSTPIVEPEIKMVKRGGKEFPMKVGNIGAKTREKNNADARDTGVSPASQQSPAALTQNASEERPDSLSTSQKAQPTEQSSQRVNCSVCREDFNEEQCTSVGELFYCEDCAASSRCAGCEELFAIQSLKLFDEFLYCPGCAEAAAIVRKQAIIPKGQPTIQPSGHDSWCTPPELVKVIYQLGGGRLALDPCSNPYATTEPQLKFSKEDNGLEKDWAEELKSRNLKGLVYVNPPYDTETLEKVATHCVEQHKRGLEILALVPCKLDQEWWQDTVFETVNAVCFVKGRIKFWEEGRPKSGAPMPCAFIYWGLRAALFEEIFSMIGRVFLLELLHKPTEEKPSLSLVKGDDE